MTQSTAQSFDGPLRKFYFHDDNQQVSWKRSGRGQAMIEVSTHASTPWLTFIGREQGEKSDRQTMVTMDPEHGRKLYEWLKELYEPKPEGGV